MKEVFTAKTMEEIQSLATKKFGVSVDKISFETIESPKKTIFGRMKGDYKVQATYVNSTNVETVESLVENSTSQPQDVVSVNKSPEVLETTSSPVVPTDSESVENLIEITTVEESAESAKSNDEEIISSKDEQSVPTKSAILEKAKIAQEYVGAILEKMGIDPSSTVTITENGAIIDFKSDGTGTIIGKRGETLDALQYLSAMICNKDETGYYRITLDSCGYRAKRKIILQELAQKVSKNVLRTGHSQSLEPMNPYERRIIHATISEIDGVTSRSIGEEPFRKVIISSTNPKKYNNGRKGGYNSHGKRGGNGKYRGNSGGKKRNYQPRSLDLKTSFEKDYRKPKPEDNLKEGLYGKIEV